VYESSTLLARLPVLSWRGFRPIYACKRTNLEYAENPFTLGDDALKPHYGDPDLAVILEVREDEQVTVALCNRRETELDGEKYALPTDLESRCDEIGVKSDSYESAAFGFQQQY
jgi:hypothetical protein